MFTHTSFALAATLLLGSISVRAAPPSQTPWTTPDLDTVAGAVTATALAGPGNGTSKAMALIRLADALVQARYLDRAKAASLQAGGLLEPPTDFMTSAARSRVVGKLAKLGDVADATDLAGVDATPEVKANLLGNLGAGEGSSGNLKAASQTDDNIRALLGKNGTAMTPLVNSVTSARADIGLGLLTSGAVDAALEIANSLPEGRPKARLLSQAAHTLCSPSADHDAKRANRGAAIVQQAEAAAMKASSEADKPFEKMNSLETAVRAVAECKGAKAAIAFLNPLDPEQRSNTLARTSKSLTRDGNYVLARAILPSNPQDPEDLLFAAQEAKDQGDLQRARTLATAASTTAVNATAYPPGTGWYDHIALLGRIFGVLVDCGAYEQAIATVQPIDFYNRQQYYVSVVSAAATRKDQAALSSLLPRAIEAMQAPAGKVNGGVNYLWRMAISLAVAGYKEEAKVAFDALMKMFEQPSSSGQQRPDVAMMAEMQAAMGDVPGALATANNAGSLIAERTVAQKRFAAAMAMMMGGAKIPPVDAAAEAQFRQLEASVPTVHPGPRADALRAIAVVMAEKGDITSAIQAEAGLEGEPRNALSGPRNAALIAICDAQLRADNPEAALATALRIVQTTEQERLLLKLAAMPARH